MNRLYENLQECQTEIDVQDLYRETLRKKFKKSNINSPNNTDGVLYSDDKKVKCLMEFKKDMDFLNINERCKVLCQVIYYLKKFEINGEELPNVIFVGDKNECFVVSVFKLVKYLQWDLDWSLPASTAYSKNPDLIKAMVNDSSLNSYVINMENDDFRDIKLMIEANAEGVNFKKKICLNNIVQEFEYFVTKIWKKQKDGELDSSKLANIFMSLIDDPDNVALVKNKLWTDYGNMIVNKRECIIFKNKIKEMHPDDKLKIETNYNILLSDCDRRASGEYPTPILLVNDTHSIMGEYIEGDWKKDYLVIDPAWGRGNLTRDCDIENLQPMTLHQADIDKAKELDINGAEDAVKFDFLNDGILLHAFDQDRLHNYLPDKVATAIENNEKIIIYMNPPFGGRAIGCLGKKKEKTKNHLNTELKSYIIGVDEKYKDDTNELYVQFLFRLLRFKEQYKLTNLYLAFFSPLGFLTGDRFDGFRSWFLLHFDYIKGMHYNAGQFSCTEDTWGVGFTIWKSCKKKKVVKDVFEFEDRKLDYDQFDTIRVFDYWHCDDCNISYRDWMKSTEIINGRVNFPRMTTNGILKEKEYQKISKDFLGIGYKLGNGVGRNFDIPKLCAVPYYKNGSNRSITSENIMRILSGFSAKIIASSDKENEYITQRFQLSKPNESLQEYEQWNTDSIVYSIFNDRCETYSMRNYKCQGKRWDVKNEFFFLPKYYIIELLEKYPYEKMYRDIIKSEERYIAKILFEKNDDGIMLLNRLSADAYDILNRGTGLFVKSLPYRKNYGGNLFCFDCGYYQLKKLWGELFPEEFKEFRNRYIEFENRLRPLVYQLGFLKGEPLS